MFRLHTPATLYNVSCRLIEHAHSVVDITRMPGWVRDHSVMRMGIVLKETDTLIGYCHIDHRTEDMSAWLSINIGEKAGAWMFNTSYEWISTSWDVYVLPIKVTEAINASQYSGYVVDDAEYVETPTGNYYWIELEQGEKEVKVKINENGEFI